MKKLFALILCITAFLIIGTVAASADVVNTGEFYIVDATRIDEILAGEAGERDIAWEVPFLHIAPKLDGTIDKNEYMPFELYEEYLTWLATNSDPTSGEIPNTMEDFELFYDSSQEGFFKPYWGWDGSYLYLAFEVNLINGYMCTPEAMGGDMYLWAYNCMQLGLSPADATGTNNYFELGYGVHSETKESLTFNWHGHYLPAPNEDFVGCYDQENQVLRYELRIPLQTILGLTDRTAENGDAFNMSWVLSVNGETTGPYDVWHLMFARGVSGPASKDAKVMARMTLVDKPDGLETPVINLPGMSEEDKEYKLKEIVDFSSEAVVKTYEGENAAIEYVTEGDQSFMRITSLTPDDYVYAFSPKYPRNVVGGETNYIVIKYRTSSSKAENLGLIYRTIFATEYDLEYCYYDTVGTDGEWHTVIFYMTGESEWRHFILNMGLVPFYDSEEHAQETFDIAWIKFYQNDPTELYEADFYVPGEDDPDDTVAEETTEAIAEETTAEPAGEATQAPDTASPAVSEDVTEAPEATGCASILGFGVTAVLMAMAAAVALKKKDK